MKWLAALCLVCMASPAVAQDIEVAAGLFIGIINEQGDGPYQQILIEAARRSGVSLNEHVYPLKRAVKAFTSKEVLVIYGMTSAVVDQIGDEQILTSYPLGVYKLFVFTRKGSAAISSVEQLKGLRVGGVIGYEAYYQTLLAYGVKLDYVGNEDLQFKKLSVGRIDAIVGFMPDWLVFADTLIYDPNFPISVGYDYLTVWKTPLGQAFVEQISPALQEMHQDGSLKAILGERYMEFEYKPTLHYEWSGARDKSH